MEPENLFKKPKSTKRLPVSVSDSGSVQAEDEGRKFDDVEMLAQECVGAELTKTKVVEKPVELVTEPGHSRVSSRRNSPQGGRLWSASAGQSDLSQSSLASDSDTEPAAKSTKLARGRGRPPTSGKYVGLAAAKKTLANAKRDATRQKMEEDILEQRIRSILKSPPPPSNMVTSEVDEEIQVILPDQLREAGKLVKMVSSKTGNLKGSYKKTLNYVHDTLIQFVNQPESMVLARLEMECTRLEKEKADQAEEIASLRRRLDQLEAGSSSHPIDEAMERLEARLSAKFEAAIMGPTIRPPLAHDLRASQEYPELPRSSGKGKGRGKGLSHITTVSRTPVSTVQRPLNVATHEVNGPMHSVQESGKKRKAVNYQVVSASANTETRPSKSNNRAALNETPNPGQQGSVSADTPWTVVSSKKKGKSKYSKVTSLQPKPHKGEPKLRPPRSAAVVISLSQTAMTKGLTYAQILTDAQHRIDLSGLNIQRLKPKSAVTGAYIYEVPGANNEKAADALADRLRACFSGTDDVRISRPTKCVELRVSGLDCTATSEMVVAALSKAGECQKEAIRVGEIRSDRSGLGTVWVKMPVKAAQIIKKADRVLIGWVAAKVTVLQTRPLRCYRCLEPGHVRDRCESTVDRSALCYRCGQPGHKARQCDAALNCALCATAGKPAGHQLGGKACAAFNSKIRRVIARKFNRSAAAEAIAQQQPECPPQAEVESMDIAQ